MEQTGGEASLDQTDQATSQAEAPAASTEAPATEAPARWTELEWHLWIEAEYEKKLLQTQWPAQNIRAWERKWRLIAHESNRWLHWSYTHLLVMLTHT